MRKALAPLLVLTLLLAAGAAAQSPDTTCNTYMRRIFYYAQTGAQFTESLNNYFKKALPDKTEPRSDSFRIHLIIDSIGRLDCRTIKYNNTVYTPEEIRHAIDGMPKWLPATQNGHPVTFCAMIIVAVDNGRQTVTYLNEHPYKSRGIKGRVQ